MVIYIYDCRIRSIAFYRTSKLDYPRLTRIIVSILWAMRTWFPAAQPWWSRLSSGPPDGIVQVEHLQWKMVIWLRYPQKLASHIIHMLSDEENTFIFTLLAIWPSGKRLHNDMEHHHSLLVNQLFLWPFSIATVKLPEAKSHNSMKIPLFNIFQSIKSTLKSIK